MEYLSVLPLQLCRGLSGPALHQPPVLRPGAGPGLAREPGRGGRHLPAARPLQCRQPHLQAPHPSLTPVLYYMVCLALYVIVEYPNCLPISQSDVTDDPPRASTACLSPCDPASRSASPSAWPSSTWCTRRSPHAAASCLSCPLLVPPTRLLAGCVAVTAPSCCTRLEPSMTPSPPYGRTAARGTRRSTAGSSCPSIPTTAGGTTTSFSPPAPGNSTRVSHSNRDERQS